MEPTYMKEKSKKLSPVTPIEKITKAMEKPIERSNVDLSSKFFLPQNDDDALDLETPTRKRSGSKNGDFKNKKKQIVDSSMGFKKAIVSQSQMPHSTSTPEKKKARSAQVPATKPQPASFNTAQMELENQLVVPPPAYKTLGLSLIDGTKELALFDDAFKAIDDALLKDEYLQIASKSFDQWVSHGVHLVDRQHEVIKRVVVARVKLNAKFKVIFSAVNEYGEKLESKDEELKDKLRKLQNLGQEIKAFISC